MTQQLVHDEAREQSAVVTMAPAVMHRRAPQPLVRIVFEQQPDETQNRVVWDHRRLGRLAFEILDDGRGIRHPATVFELHHGHLHGPDMGPHLLSMLREWQKLVGDTPVAQIRLEFSREVRDLGSIDSNQVPLLSRRRRRLLPIRMMPDDFLARDCCNLCRDDRRLPVRSRQHRRSQERSACSLR